MVMIKHYSIPLTEDTMKKLKEVTGTDISKEALSRAVEFTINNFKKEK